MPKRAHVLALETPTVCRLAGGLSPKTLDYWVRTKLVTPSILAAPGRRVPRLWSVTDAVTVKAIKTLRDAGCPLQRVRRVKNLIEEEGEVLSGRVLHWDGSEDILELTVWGAIESRIAQPQQQVLHLVALPIDDWIARSTDMATEILRPPRRSRGRRAS